MAPQWVNTAETSQFPVTWRHLFSGGAFFARTDLGVRFAVHAGVFRESVKPLFFIGLSFFSGVTASGTVLSAPSNEAGCRPGRMAIVLRDVPKKRSARRRITI